jgi:hypothetical protein
MPLRFALQNAAFNAAKFAFSYFEIQVFSRCSTEASIISTKRFIVPNVVGRPEIAPVNSCQSL